MRYMSIKGQLEYSRFVDFILEPEEAKLYVATSTTNPPLLI
jgi:hypothetical protein